MRVQEEAVQQYKGIDSKFRVVILAARRAKQLIGGGRKKLDIKAENPLTIALEEIRQGKIDFDTLNETPLDSALMEAAPDAAAEETAESDKSKDKDK